MVDGLTMEALDRTLRLCQGVIVMPGVSDNHIARALLATRIALVADRRNLMTGACQSAVAALARLATGYGSSLALVMPDVELRGYQPPLRGSSFRTALLDCANDIMPAVSARVEATTHANDLVFVFGDTEWSGPAREAWRVCADDWAGGITDSRRAGSPFTTDFPIGGLAAAAIASAEPFKFAMRELRLPLRVREQIAMVSEASVSLAPPNTPAPDSVDVGEIDCVSGGAIINAMLFTLLRLPGLRGSARIFEPQDGELPNVNRYVLMRRSTSVIPKIEMLSEWTQPDFQLQGSRLEVSESSIDSIRPLRDRVLVGVDRVPARWLVQKEWPAWLAIAGTDDFLVQASEHEPGRRCAGCAYFDAVVGPPRAPIATLSVVSFWAGLLLAVRLVRHTLGIAARDREQMIELTAPLLLNSPVAWRKYPVPVRDDCPVACRDHALLGD